ncbi:2-methylcitrate dehydratase [Paenibacillus chondroitinus]|uniref:2-methylcitrate dehydratase n=1 Tax=Paenibacillus chondroitinus TaxID=59842 RepID=A0ABU6D650_9BACL|nr:MULTISPECIES: 2-methylcitrate dehydratase [Paenibacillus]MCY9658142.1 2-methylcitrate dehydratase [Paenibacillus anseongense]MEB4793195.1 2-methylcitrate dehydratase [Paenibacillus chondroitinus]
MAYIEAEGVLVNANMKKGGKLLIQIEVTEDLENREDYFHLRKMIEKNVRFSLDNLVVEYNVTLNARTNKPVREYKVDVSGVVSEVKSEGEQAEMDLGLPAEKVPTKEETEEADRKLIDEFIRSGLAPQHEDLTLDFTSILKRFYDGTGYVKIAADLNITLGELSVMLDEYRKRVAPLATKWDDWRRGQAETSVEKPETSAAEVSSSEVVEFTEPVVQEDKQEVVPGIEEKSSQIGKDELENFILGGDGPVFEDLPYDFKELLTRKRNGETWMEIAQSLKISSSKLAADWSEYKKRIKSVLDGENGAA